MAPLFPATGPLRQIFRIPATGGGFLVGDVTGGAWLEIVRVAGGRLQVIDLEAGLIREHLDQSVYGLSVLADFRGDAKREIFLVRVSQFERPALLAVTGEGEVLFEDFLGLDEWMSIGFYGIGSNGVLYGSAFNPEPPLQRRILAYSPREQQLAWFFTVGPTSDPIVVLDRPNARSLLTWDTSSPGNGLYGHGQGRDSDRFTRDDTLYLPVLDDGGSQILMKSLRQRGRLFDRFWHGDLLTLHEQNDLPVQWIDTLDVHTLHGEPVSHWDRPRGPRSTRLQTTILLFDLLGDGREEAVVSFQDLGEVLAFRHPDLEVVARGASGPVLLLAAGDIDGDGEIEIVAGGKSEVLVLSQDLEPEMTLPADSPFGAAIVDLDHDGRFELLVQDSKDIRAFACEPEEFPSDIEFAAERSASIGIPSLDNFMEQPRGGWRLRHLLEELFTSEATERIDRGDPDPERRALLRRLMQDNRTFVTEAVYHFTHDLPGRIQNRRGESSADRLETTARLMAEEAELLWGDPGPRRIFEFHSGLTGENVALYERAVNADRAYRSLNEDGRRRDALARAEEAARGYARLGARYAASELAISMAQTYAELGMFEHAFSAAERAMELKSSFHDPRGKSRAEYERGRLLRLTGDFDGALSSFHAARGAARAGGLPSELARAETAIGGVYLSLGQHDSAREPAQEALRYWRAVHNHEEVARTERMLAEIEIRSKAATKKTAERLAGAARIAEDLEIPGLLGEILLTQAALEASADPTASTHTLQRLLSLGRESDHPVIEIRALAALARAAMREAGPARAGELALEAARRAETQGLPDLAWRCLSLAGKARTATGERELALELYLRAIDGIEALRAETGLNRFRHMLLGARTEPFDGALRTLLELDRDRPGGDHAAQALFVFERSRARALADECADADQRAGPDAGGGALYRRISALQLTLWQSDLSKEERSEVRRQLDEARRELDALHAAGESPGLMNAAAPRRPTEIVDRLDSENATLLAYHLGDESSVGLLVAGNEIRLASLPSRMEIERWAESFRRWLQSGSRWERASDAGSVLSDVLLGPFEEHLIAGTPLAVIPDGALHGVPLGALPHPARAEPLLTSHPVFAVPSASVWMALRDRLERHAAQGWKLDLVALGGRADSGVAVPLRDLEHAKEEIDDVAEILRPRSVRLLYDDTASEHAVKSLHPDGCRVLHLATHAGWPHGSEGPSIVLQDGQGEDGLLTAAEIAGLELPVELVYLSGCETATGTLVPGEGVLGLGRSLLGAGTSAVVASLWPVPDESAARMARSFYSGLLEGRSKADALRGAREQMWMEGAPPSEWAGWVLTGDGTRPLVN